MRVQFLQGLCTLELWEASRCSLYYKGSLTPQRPQYKTTVFYAYIYVSKKSCIVSAYNEYSFALGQLTAGLVPPTWRRMKMVMWRRCGEDNCAQTLPEWPQRGLWGSTTTRTRTRFSSPKIDQCWVMSFMGEKKHQCMLSIGHGFSVQLSYIIAGT